jgi:hypothetical protein
MRAAENPIPDRIQLSSDGLDAYTDAMERGFGADVDYGQVVKTYGLVNLNKDPASRYSPAEVVAIKKTVVVGAPEICRITTLHVEKQNRTIRMRCPPLNPVDQRIQQKAGQS